MLAYRFSTHKRPLYAHLILHDKYGVSYARENTILKITWWALNEGNPVVEGKFDGFKLRWIHDQIWTVLKADDVIGLHGD